MSARPEWDRPHWQNVRRLDLDAYREGMWPTLAFAAFSVGHFVLGINCTAATFTTDSFPLLRNYNHPSYEFNLYEVFWSYEPPPDGRLLSMSFAYSWDTGVLNPTVPGKVTFYYNPSDTNLIETYSWT